MKNKKKIMLIILMIFSIISIGLNAYGHSGRTDANGGHKDNKNKSGLGSYHYHCGGHPAHLHTNGVCPYSSSKQSSKSTTTTAPTQSKSSTTGTSAQSKSSATSTSTQSKGSTTSTSTQSKNSTTSTSTQSKSSTSSTQLQNKNSTTSSIIAENNQETPVTTIVNPTGIQIDETIKNIEVGESKTLTATITPSNATDKNITWKTSNESIATINTTGQIIAKKSGTVEITATTTNGKTSTAQINIKEEQKNDNSNIIKTSSTTKINTTNNTTSNKKENSSPVGGILALGLLGGGSFGGYKIYQKFKQ